MAEERSNEFHNVVPLGDGCIWILTADTYITSFTGDTLCIKSNGHCLYVNGKELKTKE